MALSDQQRLMQALYTSGMQTLEDSVFSLIPRYNIDEMSGPALDDIGIIVGQLRNGTSDEVYRIHLKGKIAVNTSQGTLDDVYRVWTAFTGTDNVEVVETFPAGINIVTDVSPNQEYIPIIKDYVDRSLLVGVSLGDIILYDPTEAFTFSDSIVPGSSALLGFGDTGDVNTGGKLAGIL